MCLHLRGVRSAVASALLRLWPFRLSTRSWQGCREKEKAVGAHPLRQPMQDTKQSNTPDSSRSLTALQRRENAEANRNASSLPSSLFFLYCEVKRSRRRGIERRGEGTGTIN